MLSKLGSGSGKKPLGIFTEMLRSEIVSLRSGQEKRVAIVASEPRSLINFRGELLAALVSEGWCVLALAPRGSSQVHRQIHDIGVQFSELALVRDKISLEEDYRLFLQLRSVFRHFRPAVTLAYTAKPVIYSGLALRRLGCAYCPLITGLGYGFGNESIKQKVLASLMTRLYRQALKRAATVIFQNQDDRELFFSRKIVSRHSRTQVVNGSGVNLSRFVPEPLPKKLEFLLVARLLEAKGIRQFVEAARIIRSTHPTVNFVIVGEPASGQGGVRRSDVERWRDEGVIEYVNFLDDVRPAYAKASVFVLPSYYREGIPRSILEAMAMGRPVITTDTPGCRETVQPGLNGFVVPPKDTAALVRAIRTFVDQPSLVASMGSESLRIAREKFDVRKVNKAMLQAMGVEREQPQSQNGSNASLGERRGRVANSENTVAIVSVYARSLVSFRGALIRDLCSRHARVYALAPDYDHQSREQVKALGAEPIDHCLNRTGLNVAQDIWASYKLVLLLRELRPNVVLSYYIKPVIFGTLAATLARVPHRVAMIEGLGSVFTVSSRTESMLSKLLRVGVIGLYRVALGQTQTTIFLNPDDQREFVDRGIVQVDKSTVLGGIGIDLSEWTFAEPIVDPLTFIFVGRLLRSKGLLEFVEAARIVKTKSPAAHFVILGDIDTKLDALSQDEISQWVDDGLVSWPGHVDVKPWLARASVFVLPSYREGVPRSTQETMAMGRPVITTDVPGCRETVEAGVNGFLVPVRNAQALAEAMMRFVHNPALIATMGLASRRIAEEKFDVRKANDKLSAILGFGPN